MFGATVVFVVSSVPYSSLEFYEEGHPARRPSVQFIPNGRLSRALLILALISGTAILFFYRRYPTYNHDLGYGFIHTPTSSKDVRTDHEPHWTWTCENHRCERSQAPDDTPVQSLTTCNMICTSSPIWPVPTLDVQYNRTLVPVMYNGFDLEIVTSPSKEVSEHITGAFELMKRDIQKLVRGTPKEIHSAKRMVVRVKVFYFPDPRMLTSTVENYQVTITEKDDIIVATVGGESFCGARHGLETLAQLIWYDSYMHSLVTFQTANVEDTPRFTYRGLLLDTARHYFPVEDIKRTLDAMAASKLNTFHWHATDSQSFPLKLESVPLMATYGAYSRNEVYTTDDIKAIVHHARLRGIRVLIEIDAPAHVGRAWSWGPSAGYGDLAHCIEEEPWRELCGEPPCGQLNPHNEYVFELLEKIYKEIIELTRVDDLFHLGGDEVNQNCWSKHINPINPMDAWYMFTQKTLKALQKANKGVLPRNTIIWSSKLTQHPYLERMKNYTVQLWGGVKWEEMMEIPKFSPVIVSHVDAWYLDCGFGSWRDESGGSCGPYRAWGAVYGHRPWGDWAPNPMLGGEACMWTELLGPEGLDSRLWPRAAALGERLWSDPITKRTDVYLRLDMQRKRLVDRGIGAEPIGPQWCSENPYECL